MSETNILAAFLLSNICVCMFVCLCLCASACLACVRARLQPSAAGHDDIPNSLSAACLRPVTTFAHILSFAPI